METNKKQSIETIARTIVLGIALLNQFLTSLGKNPIPISEDNTYVALSTILTTCAAIYAWWKNNSFTKHAMAADEYLSKIREDSADLGE